MSRYSIKSKFSTWVSKLFKPVKISFIIMGLSFRMAWQDKKYFLFSLFSFFIFCSVITAVILLVHYTVTWREFFNFIEDWHEQKTTGRKVVVSAGNLLILIGSIIAIRFVGALTSTISSVAVSDYTLSSLEGAETGFIRSISRTFSRFWVILKWSLLTAIVGLLLNAISGKGKKRRFFYVVF